MTNILEQVVDKALVRTARSTDLQAAASVLSRAVESAWRFGAFACLFTVVGHSSALPELDQRVALLAVVGVFCLVPRLDVAAVTLGLAAIAFLIENSRAELSREANLFGVSSDLAMAVFAAGLVGCASVLRVMTATPRRGLFDRDKVLLLLGLMGLSLLFTVKEVGLNRVTLIPNQSVSHGPLFQGETGQFMTLGYLSACVTVGVLGFVAWSRTRTVRDPLALQSHTVAGAALAAFAWMIAAIVLADAVASPDRENVAATVGLFIGLGIWLMFYVGYAGRNEHMRTWGAVRAAGLFGLAALAVDGLSEGNVFGVVLTAFWGWLAWKLARDTWSNSIGMRRDIERLFARAQEIERLLGGDESHDRHPAVERARMLHATATGHGYPSIIAAASRSSGSDGWNNVRELRWLRAAGAAGRWRLFRSAVNSARAELEAVDIPRVDARTNTPTSVVSPHQS